MHQTTATDAAIKPRWWNLTTSWSTRSKWLFIHCVWRVRVTALLSHLNAQRSSKFFPLFFGMLLHYLMKFCVHKNCCAVNWVKQTAGHDSSIQNSCQNIHSLMLASLGPLVKRYLWCPYENNYRLYSPVATENNTITTAPIHTVTDGISQLVKND